MTEREQRIEAIRWATRYTWHRAKFHGVRLLPYAVKLAFRSPRGGLRCLVWWGRWAFDQEGQPIRQALVEAAIGSAASDSGKTYHLLQKQGDGHIKRRLIVSGVGALVATTGLLVMDFLYPLGWWSCSPVQSPA
jgi:S-DNA-T family DNA segregation ATPase FtsK/SpoIIIE